jgi:HEAT repeats
MNSSHSVFRAARLILACGVVLLVGAEVRAQTSQPTPTVRRPHVATMRTADSSDGSRVSLTSDQSMGDYEAYRSGERFYVRIPSTEVSGGRVARGRGFEDAKVQRNGADTLLSFRLQPGTTARVEQRSNQLEVVFRAAGAPTASSSLPSPERDSPTDSVPAQTSRSARVNSPERPDALSSRKSVTNPALANTAKSTPSPTPARASSSAATQSSQPHNSAPSASASPASQTKQTPEAGLNLKARLRYLMLLARLNPLPLLIGLVVLALIALWFFQRRQTRGIRRVRPKKKRIKAKIPAVDAAEPEALPPVVAAEPLTTTTMGDIGQTLPNGDQDTRMVRVSEEVKRVLSGQDYDQSVIADGDAATRKLVAAELLSALASRNGTRHDRAREIFINHGYFEDATRDLRIADSPAERAAAARRLSFVRDREATPHLAAALQDSAPEVRRAAVEALLDQGDPGAIAPLNELMIVETDRNVPSTLIKRAINACTPTNPEPEAEPSVTMPPVESFATAPEDFTSEPDASEREVIEI